MTSREINQMKNQKCQEINHVYFKIAYSSKIALKSIKSKTKSADDPIKCASINYTNLNPWKTGDKLPMKLLIRSKYRKINQQ